MSAPTVILDACVLYPAALRDLLMRLAVHELIRARWTETIHEEWINAVLRERPDLTRAQVERTRRLMDQHALDSLVEGFEEHIQHLSLPDADDRHVLAAAIECGAEAVVTWNLSDFPASALGPQGVEAWTPDQLISRLLDKDQEAVINVMREHRASLRNPPTTADEYVNTLERQGLKNTVSMLRSRQGDL